MTSDPRLLSDETLAEAIAAWETKGPTSLTVALMADALYKIRDHVAAQAEQVERFQHALLIMQQHEIRNNELQEQIDTLTRELKQWHLAHGPGLYDEAMTAMQARAEKAEAEREEIRATLRAEGRIARSEKARADAAEHRVADLRAKVKALADEVPCHVFGEPFTCITVEGGTFPGGAAFTKDLFCLPCKLRAITEGGAA